MTREIKFRAWNTKKKIMLYADIGVNYWWCAGKRFNHTDIYEDIDIMQLTGLRDKNGKEIYEGDICKFSDSTALIYYEKKCASFMRKWLSGKCKEIRQSVEHLAANTPIVFEVIGNIYENPNLLTPNKTKEPKT